LNHCFYICLVNRTNNSFPISRTYPTKFHKQKVIKNSKKKSILQDEIHAIHFVASISVLLCQPIAHGASVEEDTFWKEKEVV